MWRRVPRGYALVVVIAALVTALHILVRMSPHFRMFVLVEGLRKALLLAFGGVYYIAQALLSVSPLLGVLVFLCFVLLFGVLMWLWQQRRWPTMILVGVLVGANTLFLGAPGYVLDGRVGERQVACTFNVDASHTIRVIRYPVERGLEYGVQQFFLVSDDGGESWIQAFQAYAFEPRLAGCANLQRVGSSGVLLSFERDVGSHNELIEYRSDDAGETWHRMTTDSG